MFEILYSKRKDVFGYNKIVAIKPLLWNWGEGEKDNSNFGIVNLDVTNEQKSEVENLNKWCLNDSYDTFIETPTEFQTKTEEIKAEDK